MREVRLDNIRRTRASRIERCGALALGRPSAIFAAGGVGAYQREGFPSEGMALPSCKVPAERGPEGGAGERAA